MKRTKRILAILLLLALVFALSACGENQAKDDTEEYDFTEYLKSLGYDSLRDETEDNMIDYTTITSVSGSLIYIPFEVFVTEYDVYHLEIVGLLEELGMSEENGLPAAIYVARVIEVFNGSYKKGDYFSFAVILNSSIVDTPHGLAQVIVSVGDSRYKSGSRYIMCFEPAVESRYLDIVPDCLFKPTMASFSVSEYEGIDYVSLPPETPESVTSVVDAQTIEAFKKYYNLSGFVNLTTYNTLAQYIHILIQGEKE